MANHYHYHQYYSGKELQEQIKENPRLCIVALLILFFPFYLPAFFFGCFVVHHYVLAPNDPYYSAGEKAMALDVSKATYIQHVDCLQELKKNNDDNTAVCNIPDDAPPFSISDLY